MNLSALVAKVKIKLFELHACCVVGYSRVRIFSIPVASGKHLLELQVSAQYATVLDTHHHTASTHAALDLLALVGRQQRHLVTGRFC